MKVPTMSNLVPSQNERLHSDRKDPTIRVSADDLPNSIALNDNPHCLKRHVSWSDTSTSKTNFNLEVGIPNQLNKEHQDIRIGLDKSSYKDQRKIV